MPAFCWWVSSMRTFNTKEPNLGDNAFKFYQGLFMKVSPKKVRMMKREWSGHYGERWSNGVRDWVAHWKETGGAGIKIWEQGRPIVTCISYMHVPVLWTLHIYSHRRPYIIGSWNMYILTQCTGSSNCNLNMFTNQWTCSSFNYRVKPFRYLDHLSPLPFVPLPFLPFVPVPLPSFCAKLGRRRKCQYSVKSE